MAPFCKQSGGGHPACAQSVPTSDTACKTLNILFLCGFLCCASYIFCPYSSYITFGANCLIIVVVYRVPHS